MEITSAFLLLGNHAAANHTTGLRPHETVVYKLK